MNYININKHIRTLQKWGISLFTTSTDGYILSQPIKLLDEKFICNKIKTGNIKILPIINSTNKYLLKHLAELSSGDICIAEYQYAGCGRRDHKWFSPFGVNIYFSMYWRLKFSTVSISGLSVMIGVVIAEVLQKLISTNQIQVKWPNDLYLKNRKLAGILIELINNIGGMLHLVIGIGINIAMCDIRKKIINQNWISLHEVCKDVDRNILVVCLIKKLHTSLICFEQEGLTPFLSNWKQLDSFINCPVKLILNNKTIYGISRGVNTNGALLLEQNGIISQWVDGEVSLRKV